MKPSHSTANTLNLPPVRRRGATRGLTSAVAVGALLALTACSSGSNGAAASPSASTGTTSSGTTSSGTTSSAASPGGASAAPSSSGSVSSAGPSSTTAGTSNFKVCMGTGGQGLDWQKGQGDVARALAKQRGWAYVELSNNNDGPTAVKNAGVFIQDKCNAVIEFNGTPSVNPVLAQKFAAAKVPVITYDIGQKGWYFVGIDNQKAGEEGGAALGQVVKTKWNCQVDLVLSSEGVQAGIVNTERTGGMRTGFKSVCPDVPAADYVSYEGNGQVSTAEPAARSALAAHPDAKRIVAVGINDSGVLGTLQAAEQLGRASEIIGWGQDGSFITGKNVDPHLAGSVFYFLEGYPVYAFTQILDKIAAGNPPAVGDNTSNNPTVLIPPCPVSAAQAAAVPSLTTRVAKLLAAAKGTTENSLFCKTAG